MDNITICKRMAKIEGVEVFMYQHVAYGNVLCREMLVGGIAPQPYNPLTDDALCFKLMVKYKIDLYFTDDGYTRAWQYHHICGQDSLNKSTNRAICLAIIEAHK
jgi:hypothetical protein